MMDSCLKEILDSLHSLIEEYVYLFGFASFFAMSALEYEDLRVLDYGAICLLCVYVIFSQFRNYDRIPKSIDDIKLYQIEILTKYQEHPLGYAVMFGFVYIFLQTFAIPGSILLNVVAGLLFGRIKGVLFVCVVT